MTSRSIRYLSLAIRFSTDGFGRTAGATIGCSSSIILLLHGANVPLALRGWIGMIIFSRFLEDCLRSYPFYSIMGSDCSGEDYSSLTTTDIDIDWDWPMCGDVELGTLGGRPRRLAWTGASGLAALLSSGLVLRAFSSTVVALSTAIDLSSVAFNCLIYYCAFNSSSCSIVD